MEGPYTRHPRATLWLLEGDDFTMGADGPDAFTAEVPSIYIGKSVITNEEYEVYDPSHPRCERSVGDRDPVVNVSFRDAVGYCDWYSEATGKAFGLPSELQWEFAAQGGSGASAYAWAKDNSGGRAHEVETKRANPFGLHDMLGLVWEWTSSLHQSYPIVDGDGRDDLDRVGPRAIRGGSYRTPSAELGPAVRDALAEDTRREDLGFRIVRLLKRR